VLIRITSEKYNSTSSFDNQNNKSDKESDLQDITSILHKKLGKKDIKADIENYDENDFSIYKNLNINKKIRKNNNKKENDTNT